MRMFFHETNDTNVQLYLVEGFPKLIAGLDGMPGLQANSALLSTKQNQLDCSNLVNSAPCPWCRSRTWRFCRGMGLKSHPNRCHENRSQKFDAHASRYSCTLYIHPFLGATNGLTPGCGLGAGDGEIEACRSPVSLMSATDICLVSTCASIRHSTNSRSIPLRFEHPATPATGERDF